MDPVTVLHERKRTHSKPGQRTDAFRVAVVVEGGGPRGAYSAGMLSALKSLGLVDSIDAIFGSSAGAFNAAWLLAGQSRIGAALWSDPDVTAQTFRGRNVLRRRPVVDARHLVRTVYTRQVRMNFPAVLENPISFHPIATDADTGVSVDLNPHVTDVETLKRALIATGNLPLLGGPPVHLGNARYIDAGVSEPVPIHSALRWKPTHVLVLRTTPDTAAPLPIPAYQRTFMRQWLKRRAPGAVETWLKRYERDLADERTINRYRANGGAPAVAQIRPPAGPGGMAPRFQDTEGMGTAVASGYQAAIELLAITYTREPL